ncbi:MAG: endonuclease/exonuclease/phosphatase family protein [Labilithrix sp.]|nr:endonuclease/exonuclease/phosphatase family protein [Labilithrix sp.]
MRVVTWNMGCGSPRYTGRYRKAHDEAWRLLLGFEPDVILVQEALLDVPAWVRDEETVIVAQPPGYEGQDAGCAIVVRGGLMATRHLMTIEGSYFAAAEVTGRDGPMFVASIHVDTKDQQKHLRSLVDALRPMLDGRRFIVGGDFNACRRWDVVYKKNVYGWFFDELAALGAHDCHFGRHEREDRSFWGHQAKEAYQLDHLFVERSGASRVRSCDVVTTDDTRRLSDHSPVLLELG